MEILEKCAIFNGIDDIENILSCINYTVKKYKKGEYIYYVNDIIENICIVLKGDVDIEKEDYWGNRYIIDRVTSGEMFAESIAFSKSRKMHMNVISNRNSEIMFLDYKNIISLCENSCNSHNKLIYNLMRVIASKNVKLITKMEHICKRTIKEKVMSYLSEQAIICSSNKFNIDFNRQELADYLSVDRSALSTVIHSLKNEGLIDFDKNTFILNCN